MLTKFAPKPSLNLRRASCGYRLTRTVMHRTEQEETPVVADHWGRCACCRSYAPAHCHLDRERDERESVMQRRSRDGS